MTSRRFEIGVGALVLILAAALLVFGLRSRPSGGGSGYTLYAVFEDVSGIRAGSVVSVSGVPIGRVTSVELDEYYSALVAIQINEGVLLPDGSEIAWRQSDLLGSPGLSVIPFGDPQEDGAMLDGDYFSDTDPADNFFEVLSGLAAGSGDG